MIARKPQCSRRRLLASALLGTLVALAAAGCGLRARATKASGPPVERIEMEPVQILAERDGDRVRISHQSAASLFREAARAFEAGRHADAARAYRQLLSGFPESRYVGAARYNLGLSLEGLDRHREALETYRAILADGPSAEDGQDARFRMANCLMALEEPRAAADVLEELLGSPGLGRQDRLLATVRLGRALLAAGELDAAEAAFRSVLRGPAGKGRPKPMPLSGELQAEARYGLAEVEHERFKRQPIRLPQTQMERDVNDKARAFLRAQAGYLRTIRTGVRDLVTSAGLNIGVLYEEFYDDLMKAPVPPELTEEEREIYFEELRKEIRPLVTQAIHVYERSLVYAERAGADNDWVRRVEERLGQLRRFLDGDVAAEPGSEPPPDTDPTSPDFVGPPAPRS